MAGFIPPVPEDTNVQSICDDTLYNFAPSFGPFAIDQCGDKVVSKVHWGVMGAGVVGKWK